MRPEAFRARSPRHKPFEAAPFTHERPLSWMILLPKRGRGQAKKLGNNAVASERRFM